MLRKTLLPAAIAAAALASPLAAAEKVVLMMGDSFFPTDVYVHEGDTIRFINATGEAHSATAEDGSWDTGVLNQDEEYVITYSSGMEMEFESVNDDDVKGMLIEGDAPLHQ